MTWLRSAFPLAVQTFPVFAGLSGFIALVNLGGLSVGWWWVTTVVALVGTVLAPGRAAIAALLIGTVLAWAVSLGWQSGTRTIDIADVLGAMALNARGFGWAVLAITFVYAVLLALAGAWIGAAIRRAALEFRPRWATHTEPDIEETDVSLVHKDDKVQEEEHV